MDIRFLTKSRNYFTYLLAEECENIDLDGVKYDGELLRFSTSDFKDPKECETWFKLHDNQFKKKFVSSETQYKILHMFKTESSSTTDSEWEKIQSHMTRPGEFKKEDVVVYHPLIAHNLIDRDIERFQKLQLDGFVKSFPDKSILMGHQQNLPGVGRIFDAQIESKSIDETLEIVRDMPRKYKDLIPTATKSDNGINFVRISFYTLKSKVDFVRDMDAGIIKDMSLGFHADGIRAIKDADKNTLYWEYTGEGEALEASFVWLGAQYGAQNQKNAKDTPPTDPVETDDNPLKSEELETHAAKKDINITGGPKVKLKSKALDLDIEFTEETIETAQTELDEKVSKAFEALDGIDGLMADRDELVSLKAVLGDDINPDSAKQLKEQANARRTELIEEVIKYGSLIELIKSEDVEAKREQFGDLEVDALSEKLSEYKTIHDQRNPGKEVLENKDEPEKKEIQTIPDSRFETI